MNIIRDNVKFEITREEAQTLNDFYMAMNYEDPFSDWSAETIWDFLELLHEKVTGDANPEEVFSYHDDTIEIVFKN